MHIPSESSKQSHGFPVSLPSREVRFLFQDHYLLYVQEARIVEHFCGSEHFRRAFDIMSREHLEPEAILLPKADFERVLMSYPSQEMFRKFRMKEKGPEGYAVLTFVKQEWYMGGKPRISKVTILPGAKLGVVTKSLEKTHKDRREEFAHLIGKETNGGSTQLILNGFVEFKHLSSAARFLAGSPQAGATYFESIGGSD